MDNLKLVENNNRNWIMKKILKNGDTKYTINEPIYIENMIKKKKIYFINNKLYNNGGEIQKGEVLLEIQNDIQPFLITGIASKTEMIYKALCIKAYKKAEKPKDNEIHFKNISLSIIDGKLQTKKETKFSINKIQHDLNMSDNNCQKWLNFLNNMLEELDIQTVQEYLGYLFVATTKAQKSLFIRSGGGEGKSVLINVIQHIFGDNAIRDKVQSLASNKFKLATLENKLVFFDDDLNTEGLSDTGLFKEVITNDALMMVEEKGKDSRPADIYTRFFCIGNSDITSLYDHSSAFYDRIIPLTTKGNKMRDSKHEIVNFHDEIIKEELNGIINWGLDGLLRLHNNKYKFTISQKTKFNIENMKTSNDSVTAFFQSDYIEIAEGWTEKIGYQSTACKLLESYNDFCTNNAEIPKKGFARSFKQVVEESGKCAKYEPNLKINGKHARGYEGIKIN